MSTFLYSSRQGHLLLHVFVLLIFLVLRLLCYAQGAYSQQYWLSREFQEQEGYPHSSRRIWQELEYLIALHGTLILHSHGFFNQLLLFIFANLVKLLHVFNNFGSQIVWQPQGLHLNSKLLQFFDCLLDLENCRSLFYSSQTKTLLHID